MVRKFKKKRSLTEEIELDRLRIRAYGAIFGSRGYPILFHKPYDVKTVSTILTEIKKRERQKRTSKRQRGNKVLVTQ